MEWDVISVKIKGNGSDERAFLSECLLLKEPERRVTASFYTDVYKYCRQERGTRSEMFKMVAGKAGWVVGSEKLFGKKGDNFAIIGSEGKKRRLCETKTTPNGVSANS